MSLAYLLLHYEDEMKARLKDRPEITGYTDTFNTHALSEVVMYFDDGDADSVFMKDVQIQVGEEWKDLKQAFADKDIITDNLNTRFGPPRDDAARERGFNW